MSRFRLRRNRLERELRSAAPQARPEFVAALAEQVKPTTGVRRTRLRVGLAVALVAAALASVVALGAPGYVRAAVSAVQHTATSLTANTVASTAGPNGKTTICHRTGSLSNPFVQITVSNSAVPAHQAHGDIIPAPSTGCPTSLGSGGDQYGNGVPICHHTGSSTNPYVLIVVAPSAVPAHQAHGDIIPAPPSGCPQGVPKKADTTTVTVNAPSSFSVGDDAIFTVTVRSDGTTPPEGDVTCLDNGNPFDRAPVENGAATCDETFDAEGSHTITATFQTADAGFWTNAASVAATTTIARGGVTVTLASSGSPSAAGASVTFTATVAPLKSGGAAPTGTVQFLDDTTPLGAAVTLSSGHASLSVPSPASGTHTITAVYGGDANYGIGTSAALTHVVSASTTSLSLGTGAGTFTVGTPVTLSTTLGSADGTHPQGGITFTDNGVAFATLTPNEATASVTWTPTTTGSHVITAAFASANNAKWTDTRSTSTTVVVGIATSSVTLTTSASPAGAGSTVTLTAKINSPAAGIAGPSGTVQFREGSATLGTSTVTGGSATLSLGSLAVGTHTVTAVYSGDSLYAGSTSAALAQQIVASSVTLTYTGPTSGAYGQSLTLSSTGAPAGATVTYATPVGTVSAVAGSTATITPNWTGAKLITVTYAGDASHLAASTSATITIGAASAVAVTATPSSVAFGQAVTFAAKVTVTGATLPSGSTVTFAEGGTTLGTAPVDSAGNASLTVSTFAVGAHTVTATYGGSTSANILPGSGSATATVQGLATSISYTGPATVAAGQTLTLTAATTGIPTGATITFALPGGTTATGTVSGGSVSATATASWTPLNGTTVTVSYAGDATHAAASANGTITLVQHPVTLALSSSSNPRAAYQSLTYSVQLTTADGTVPFGTVTITDNGATIGSTTLGLFSFGRYAVTITAANPGTHTIVASYATSDSTRWSSTSATLVETITKPDVSVSLTTSNANANPGASVTFTATVLPVVRVTASPTGTVTFLDGSVTIGTATINASGVATLTTSTLAPGPHTITASYGGDAIYDGESSAGLAQTVVQTPTTTNVTTSDSSAAAGQSVTFTATVLAGLLTPLTTGTVQFSSDGTTLGSSPVGAGGIATFTTSALPGGSHTITATYVPASANYLASSGTVTETVAPPATTLVLSASTLKPAVGGSVTLTATVTSNGAAVTAGYVVFSVDSTIVGTSAVDSHGQAQLTTGSFGSAGTHPVAAAFVGNPLTAYIPSLATLSLTVGG